MFAAESHSPLVTGNLEEISFGDGVFRAARRTKEYLGTATVRVFNGASCFKVEANVIDLTALTDKAAVPFVDRMFLPGEALPGECGCGKVDHGDSSLNSKSGVCLGCSHSIFDGYTDGHSCVSAFAEAGHYLVKFRCKATLSSHDENRTARPG
jgi:hypothetical protein